jgi:hypothetical protein
MPKDLRKASNFVELVYNGEHIHFLMGLRQQHRYEIWVIFNVIKIVLILYPRSHILLPCFFSRLSDYALSIVKY